MLNYIRLYPNAANRVALENPRVDHFGCGWGVNDVHAPTATARFAAKEENR